MAIAHVCMDCGLDLARRRALIEPHYGLPLVTCSRCGRLEVRRRHPIQQRWRALLRIAKSTLAGAAQILLLLLFAGLAIMGAYSHSEMVNIQRIAHLDEMQLTFAVLGLIVLPVFTGAWLGSALDHWPYKTQWLGWAGFVLLLGWIAPIGYHGLERMAHGTAWPAWSEWRNSLIIFVFMWVVSFGGLPIGTLVKQAATANSKQRWRNRRARIRKRRAGS